MIIIVLGLAIILAIIAYNMYQENQYRKQVREQFGHSDKDALLASKTKHVRDGKESGGIGLFLKKPSKSEEAALRNLQEQDEIYAAKAKLANPAAVKTDVELAMEDDFGDERVEHTVIGLNNQLSTPAAAPAVQSSPQGTISMEELTQVDLPWFDARFDYLAYIVLDKAQELHALPRLSGRNRFQIIGCTLEDRFHVAEPIPGVYYQAFVAGMQAVSRNGVASAADLAEFNSQVDAFAQLTGGKVKHTDAAAFGEVAQALDDFCARVDRTIALHLMSGSRVSARDIRTAAEQCGFRLHEDGRFYFRAENGQPVFSIAMPDDAPFNGQHNYRGFSMLFDIPRVPAGEKTFDLFMDLAVSLTGQLNLDLYNDNGEEVSTQWLRDLRAFVLARQEEMLKVGIKPGSKTALRLFS